MNPQLIPFFMMKNKNNEPPQPVTPLQWVIIAVVGIALLVALAN